MSRRTHPVRAALRQSGRVSTPSVPGHLAGPQPHGPQYPASQYPAFQYQGSQVPGGGPGPGHSQPSSPLRAAIAAVCALLAAVAVGAAGLVASGFAAYTAEQSSPSASWAPLGWFLLGLLGTAVLASLAYGAALRVASRRVLPPGRRAGASLIALAGPHVAVVGALLMDWMRHGLVSSVVVGAAVAAWVLLCLGAGPAAFAWSVSQPGHPVRRRLLVGAASLGAFAVVGCGVGVALLAW